MRPRRRLIRRGGSPPAPRKAKHLERKSIFIFNTAQKKPSAVFMQEVFLIKFREITKNVDKCNCGFNLLIV
ncbi:hypothetical protein BAVI_23028 [Neobacillus vireti LMG 21834]|uniref:Uncharacterized protein n=1 Tax=Neobacillus vireti LMG 21834 TaxID=1131730 RepID=A0AB94IGY7_9BACI|nr:hypothetical protein BAVI_23028 [Neobacillus vireti LMG 21834]